ncbi:unnamed protein product [Parajaminaea phylloscopi]
MAVAGSRGYTVSHQKVALELGFSGAVVLAGFTELTIVPSDRSLRTVYLNTRQCTIHSVSCGGHAADFTVNDHLSGIKLSDPRDVHRHPEFKRKLYAAASDGQGGELGITLPAQIQVEPVRTAASQEASTPANSDLAPIVVRIEYSLTNPFDAIHVARASADAPWRQPHMYTSPTCPDFSRCWVPCVDSLWERSTWEFEFVVPRNLSNSLGWTGDGRVPADEAGNMHKTTVICTGDLVEQTVHPNVSGKVIFSFVQTAPTSVHHVGFAAGCFEAFDVAGGRSASASAAAAAAATAAGKHADSALAQSSDAAGEGEEESELQMIAFCLPGRAQELQNSCRVLRQAMQFYSREFGSYPFGSYKAVFIEDAVTDVHNTSTLSIFSADILHPPSVIDQALETRQLLAHALAVQWVGINIVQRSWSDTWLINGLGLYITGLFWKRLMGNNEYRFRLRKDCDRVCAWDVGMPPLCQTGVAEPPDVSLLPFINLKAPLVLHILDRRLCKAGASVGLGRVIPRVFLQAITGELPGNTLSTSSFLRTCRKVSGIDLRTFVDQWIYGSGCPRFFINSHFNRKKLTIEIHVRQESPAYQYAEYRPELAVGSNPVKLFDGQMTIRIHEADGRPYEHVLDIKTPHKRYDVPFNTKYKRVRRNTKRFQARQAAAVAAAEGDQDAAEAIGMIDLGFSLALWENEEQRERWKVADWTEDDEDIMSQAAYEWIRMDSDFEWIASLHVEQPDFMWVSQLQRDRDVVAQLQAVQALAQMPNAISSSMLTRTVLVHKYFYRIRTEACHALVNCAVPQLGYLGLFHLLMLFRTNFCIDVPIEPGRHPLDLVCIPRANDFSDPAEYFIRKAMVHAFSRVRNERGRTLPQVKKLLINLLRYNDNSTNHFADDFYVAELLSALSSAFVPVESTTYGGFVPAGEDPDAKEDPELFGHAFAEVSRLQELDKLVPSYHNIVSLACLEWHASMILSGQEPLDLRLFLGYTQQGTFTPLRIAAFNYLLILSGLKHRLVVRYLFAVLQDDDNRMVKRSLAKALCDALSVAIATGDVMTAAQAPDAVIEDTSGGNLEAAEKAREKEMEQHLRSLRREVGRSAAVREGFLAALLAADVDSEARWALVKLAELLFKPTEETELPLQPRPTTTRPRISSSAGIVDHQMQSAVDEAASAGLPKIKLINRTTSADDAVLPAASPPTVPSASRVVFESALPAPTKKSSMKPKKPKPLAQAQAAGMSHVDLTACRNALKKMQSNKHATLFAHPVDPVRDGAPNYHKVIREPMDLSTIDNKLEAGLYTDRFAFEHDFDLLVANAKKYTPDPTAFVHKAADALDKAFKALWARTNKTLEQSAAKQARSKGPSDTPDATAHVPMAPPPLPARDRADSVTKVAATPIATPTTTTAVPATKALGLKLKLKPKVQQPDAVVEKTARPDVKTKKPASEPASTASVPVLSGTSAEHAHDKGDGTSSASAVKPKLKKAGAASKASSQAVPTTSASDAASAPFTPLQPVAQVPPGEDPIQMGKGEAMHVKQCKALLQSIKKLPEAYLFLAPVNEAYAPGYFDVVKSPMDLGTMETKLNSAAYVTMDEFARDMEQIFTNAYLYADLTAVEHAVVLRDVFRKREWPKAMQRRLEYTEKRSLQGIFSRLRTSPQLLPTTGLFTQPVSEIVQVLPHYFDVIPRAKARDLGMIADKLKSDQYGSPRDVDADVRLMMSNARTFNAGNEAVLEMVTAFERLWAREVKAAGFHLDDAHGGAGKKRKEHGEKAREGGSKKQKGGAAAAAGTHASPGL